MTDATTDLPACPAPPRRKDATAALRARRARRKRKAMRSTIVPSVTASIATEDIPVSTSTVTPPLKSWEFPCGEDHPERHGQRDVDRSVLGNLGVGRSIAIRDAARNAATLTGSAAGYVTRLLALDEVDSTSPALYSPPRAGKGRAGVDTTAHSGRLTDILAYAVAVGLAAIAAWFSLKGLVVLFPGAAHEIVVMGAIMEAAKLVACGWLAGAWRHVPWVFRGVLMLLIAGLAVINASGTFSQLTAAHVGSRAVSSATLTMQGTDLDSRIEVAAVKLADVDRRISSIDAIVAGAAQRGRANTAASLLADQHKTRTALVAERQQAAQALAELKVERGGIQARATIAESEAMPLRYAAELIGVGGDSEKAIRWLIALMVLCCDPLAIALTAAVSARGSTTARNHIWSAVP